MATTRATYCVNHPAAHALALCVGCRKQICAECATSWEGVNLCTPCLRSRSGAAESRGWSAAGWISTLLVIGAMVWLLPRLMVMIAVVVAGTSL